VIIVADASPLISLARIEAIREGMRTYHLATLGLLATHGS